MIEPLIIEEGGRQMVTLSVFGKLLQNRIIFLGEQITSEVANVIQAQLLYLASKSDEDITLYINSPGGSVSAGLAIYDTMKLVKPDIKTVCTGTAASMAAILLAAGTKGKRSILPHSRVMIHQPSGGAFGTASDILIEAEEIKKCRQELADLLAEATGKPVKTILKDLDRDKWFNANEALEYNLVDEIK